MGWLGSGRPSAAVAVAVLIAGGVLTGGAAIAGSSGTRAAIHACVSKRTGAVRVAVHCRAGESVLTWDQQGPAGQAGQAGTPGVPGPAGPSVAYAVYSGISFGVFLTTTLATVGPVLTLPAPPGNTSYVVSAEVLMGANSTLGIETLCELSIGSTSATIPELDAGFWTAPPGRSDNVMPLTASGVISGTPGGTTTAQVQCNATPAGGGTGTLFVTNVRITATRVGNLDVTVAG